MNHRVHNVARHIQERLCTEVVSLLYTPIQSANEPYQEPAAEPTEIEQTFLVGVNPQKNKISVNIAGVQIPADFSVFVYIPSFQDRTGITVDVENLDWLTHCRMRVRGALCSVTHYHITGPDSVWLTVFVAREQV